MKKNVFLILFCALAILGGLIQSSCKTEETGATEDSVGILKLTNNSTNVRIVYVSLEKGGKKVVDFHVNISPGSSYPFGDTPTGSYTVFLEDPDGDGWATNSSVTVKKDSTAEVKFPGDFKVSN